MRRKPFLKNTELERDELEAMKNLRHVFLEDQQGRDALAWLLQRCRFFDRVESDEDVTLYLTFKGRLSHFCII